MENEDIMEYAFAAHKRSWEGPEDITPETQTGERSRVTKKKFKKKMMKGGRDDQDLGNWLKYLKSKR